MDTKKVSIEIDGVVKTVVVGACSVQFKSESEHEWIEYGVRVWVSGERKSHDYSYTISNRNTNLVEYIKGNRQVVSSLNLLMPIGNTGYRPSTQEVLDAITALASPFPFRKKLNWSQVRAANYVTERMAQKYTPDFADVLQALFYDWAAWKSDPWYDLKSFIESYTSQFGEDIGALKLIELHENYSAELVGIASQFQDVFELLYSKVQSGDVQEEDAITLLTITVTDNEKEWPNEN